MIKQISDSETLRRWAEALTAVLFSVAAGVVCAWLTPSIGPVELAAIKAALPGWLHDSLTPEPAERNAFLGAILTLPFGWLAAGAIFRNRKVSEVAVSACLTVLAAVTLAAVFFPPTFRGWLLNTGIAGVAAMAAGVVLIGGCDRFRQFGKRLPAPGFIMLALLPALLQVWTTRIYFPEYVNFVDRNHFGLVSQSIVNHCNGLFVPSQYGSFALFLLPWFSVFGHSVISISVMMGLLFLGSMAILLFLWTKFMRNRLLILAGACAMTLLTGSFISLHRGDFDPYFQYHPIRSLGPALAALFVYLMLKHGWNRSWLTASGAVAATFGIFWNLDSGLISIAALSIWLGWNAICRLNRENVRDCVIFAAVCGIMTASLLAATGTPIASLFQYQRLFFLIGYYMLPMPLGLHIWPMVLGGYFVLWGWSTWMIRRTPKNRFWQLQFFMSTLGIGLFIYYLGRSVDTNLIAVSWPAFWSMTALFDRYLRYRRATNAQNFGLKAVGLVPVTILGLLLGTYCADFPLTLQLCRQVGGRMLDRKAEYYRDFEFIRQHAPADGVANLIGPGQGFYSAQTGLIPGFQPFNQMELVRKDDFENYLSQLVLSQKPLFVISRKFIYEWEPPAEFFDRFYVLQAVSPSGRVRYFLPRPSSP